MRYQRIKKKKKDKKKYIKRKTENPGSQHVFTGYKLYVHTDFTFT